MATLEVTFQSNLDDIKNAARDQIEAALEAVGQAAETFVAAKAPTNKKTGGSQLKQSITHTVKDDTVYVGTNESYAVYVEFGTGKYAENGKGRPTPWVYQDDRGDWHRTSGSRAQPFMRPGINDHIEDFKRVIIAHLSD
jgi:HK97 gp10 family phage protein